MKREKKFRAWYENSQTWVYFYVGQTMTNTAEEIYAKICLNGGEWFEYTGVKDKNGKEIYEGDIIQYKSYYVNKRWWSDTKEIPIIEKEVQKQKDDFTFEKDKVIFRNGGFVLGHDIFLKYVGDGKKIETGSTHSCNYESKIWDFEILGNIHENPELLS